MKTHWKKNFNYDYLGAHDLEPGKDTIATIRTTSREMVTGNSGKKEECFVCQFEEIKKPMVLNRTNCKAISKVSGSQYIEDWQGTKVSIYIQVGVQAFGTTTDALRIRPIAPKVNINYSELIPKLESAKTEEELRKIWKSMPSEAKKDPKMLNEGEKIKKTLINGN